MPNARDRVLIVDSTGAVACLDALAAAGFAVSSVVRRYALDGTLRSESPTRMSAWPASATWSDHCRAAAAEAKATIATWPVTSKVQIFARAGTTHVEKAQAIMAELFSGDRTLVTASTKEIPLVAARLTRSTRTFSAGQLVYVFDVYWGMNEAAKVIGRYRRKHRFVEGVCPISILDDCRPKRVATPAILRLLDERTISRGLFNGRFWPMPLPPEGYAG